jgi:hypothetical protein
MKVRSLLLNHGLVVDDNLHHFNEMKQKMISLWGKEKEDLTKWEKKAKLSSNGFRNNV